MLVAENFNLENPNNYKYIHHIDKDKSNNKIIYNKTTRKGNFKNKN